MAPRDKRGPKKDGMPTGGFGAKIVEMLRAGPKTPKQLACEFFGSSEAPFGAAYVKRTGNTAKRVRCEDPSGTARVGTILDILLRRGEIRRVSKGVYALPDAKKTP